MGYVSLQEGKTFPKPIYRSAEFVSIFRTIVAMEMVERR